MALVKTILNSHTVEYDDTEFEVLKEAKNVYLHYVGDGSNITNPKGNTSCYRMFEDFEGTNLDLSKFNTSEITNMSFMFANCCNLKSLNLFSFNTNKITDMDNMFYDCINLETLKVGSDYLQFFSINRALLKIGNSVNIIPVTKIDRTIEDLFY